MASSRIPEGARPDEVSRRFREAAKDLTALFDRWAQDPFDLRDEALDGLAHRAFEIQYAGNLPYRRFCEARGADPSVVSGWRDVPAVPTAAFRVVDLVVGDPEAARLVFRTSGTSRGATERGRHFVRAPELYRSSLRAAARHGLLPRGETAIIVTLHEPFVISGDSSLAWMLDDVRAAFGAAGSFCAATDGSLDWSSLTARVEAVADAGPPVCLLGTTLAFDAWLGELARDGSRLALPEGSRVMDTGGAKGRQDLAREDIVAGIEERLGIPRRSIVNEFGMTELLSQRYGPSDADPILLRGPPWLRTRALDPVTLEELPDGRSGVLCHFDLANLGSVCAVLTEDLGQTRGNDLVWEGRSPGAPPRGCSLAMAELLRAQTDA